MCIPPLFKIPEAGWRPPGSEVADRLAGLRAHPHGLWRRTEGGRGVGGGGGKRGGQKWEDSAKRGGKK